MKEHNLLDIRELSLSFQMYHGLQEKNNLPVISELSLSLRTGEVMAIVGSSGSGKSLLAHAILGILPKNAELGGEIYYDGSLLTEQRRSSLRGREIMFVPQSVNNLDPTMKVGKQVQGVYGTKKRQQEAFIHYDLPPETAGMYPFQLSGGMARRVLISMTMMQEARLVVADEPTPGMSIDLAEETLKYFRKMADGGAGVLLITHDIDLALLAADRVAVFYAGTIVEIADKEDFAGEGERLRHPYTKALWQALPQNQFRPISGVQPYAGTVTKGCRFADRCAFRGEDCGHDMPLRKIRGGEVRCCRAL
ncbi:MAG: ABC transporter ATP-binding protein [Clostridiales bacterium]|nr:ABC transporter ATP-binding protein [Clostridiales bacterium]